MNTKRFIMLLAALLLLGGVPARADGVSVPSVKVKPGEQFTVSINLQNEQAYSAFMFDLTVSEKLSIVKEEKEDGDKAYAFSLSEERKSASHVLSYREHENGVIRIVGYSSSSAPFAGNDGSVVTIKMFTTENTPEGNYELKLSNIAFTTPEAVDVPMDDVAGTIVVKNPEPITITAKSYSRQYGDENPALEFSSEGPELDGTPEIICVATAESPVGTYDIIVNQGTVKNENVTYVNGTLTVEKAPLTISAGTYMKKQGDPLPEFTLAYDGFRNNETTDVLTVQPTVSCAATSDSAPGEYEVTASGAEARNYAISYVSGKLIVTEADAIVVTAKSCSRKYGDPNPSFEYEVSGGELSGTPEITCEADASSPAGTYDIVITKGTVGNFNVTYVNGTLTVEKAPLTISAGTYTKKQGDPLPEFTLAYDGFRNGETQDVLTVQPTVSCAATSDSAPGEYEVTASGAEARNYAISYVSGKLIVTEADAIVVTAKSCSRKYGDPNPSFEYEVSGGELSGTPEITCEADASSPSGTYDIVITKGTVGNFNVTYVNGTLTVEKAPLTISAGTYTKKQGDPLPEFTLAYDGFRNGETQDVLTVQPTVSCAATSDSAPGEYEVTVSGAEARNYTISYVSGKLIVTEKSSYLLTYLVDGIPYKTCSLKEGDVIIPETEPVKEGYTFSGWSEIPEVMPAHDVTVTGTFTINTYELTYQIDGEVYKTYRVEYGTVITSEEEPVKEGYTFSGWSEIPEIMPDHDVTVSGTFNVNTYKLTYHVDGKEYKVYEIEYGATITPEAEPTKEGHTFSGWSWIPSKMPAEDVVVTGSFTVNTYKLTYQVDGEGYKVYEIEYGAAITPETEPTKEGYTFSGWSWIPSKMPAEDVIVTGSFTVNTYKLTYQVDGEEYKVYEIEYGTAITPEAKPTKEGYTFSGWSEIPETMPAWDVTVSGSFTINSYKLTYMIDEEVYKVVEYEFGATITPEPQPEGDYIRFEWVGLPETMPANDITVYADYETGISFITLSQGIARIFSPEGIMLERLQKGLNIVLMNDGTIRKVFVK